MSAEKAEASPVSEATDAALADAAEKPKRLIPVEPTAPAEPSGLEDFQRQRLERKLERAAARIPRRFRWASLADIALLSRITRATREQLAHLARAPLMSDKLLIGPSGAGKTSIACALLRAVIDAGRTALEEKTDPQAFKRACRVHFVEAYELARAQMHSRLGSTPEKASEAMSASLLVLDDLGTEVTLPASSAELVSEIILRRHGRGKPTVVTTYLSDDDVMAHYGAGIERRIRSGDVIDLSG